MFDISQIILLLGHGEDQFPMDRGEFTYIEKVTRETEVIPVEKKQEGKTRLFELQDDDGEIRGSLEVIEQEGTTRLHLELQDTKTNRITYILPKKKNEHFYGGGEIFPRFDLNGEQVHVWVAEHQSAQRMKRKLESSKKYDQWTGRELPFSSYETYYAQPTLVSSEKYFIHSDSTGYVAYDLSKEETFLVSLRENRDLYIGEARSFPALSRKLQQLLGGQRELPEWLQDGLTLAVQRGTAEIDEKIKAAETHGIPVNGIWSQDWCGCRRTAFGYQVMWNWQLDQQMYGDLEEKIREWKKKGIRFLGYINPFLALDGELYREASARGYCVKDRYARDYLVSITNFPAAMVDFTNPAAYAWYKDIIKKNMIGIGMSGWMADFGEYLPTDCVLYSGEDPRYVHNTWPSIWARLNQEAVEESLKSGEVFYFTRAGHTESVKYARIMWTGDQYVDWSVDDGIPSVIPASLSMGLIGFGLSHSDIGGYTTNEAVGLQRSKELLIRWAQMNTFSPYMRFHEGNQPWANVQFDGDGEQMDILAKYVRLHILLKPYILHYIRETVDQGIPLMRPLFYHYDEPQAYTEGYEYLFGRDILVAPVLKDKEVRRSVYLPDDEWILLTDNADYRGGVWTVDAPLSQIPVFVRKDSLWLGQLQEAYRRVFA